MYAVVRPLRKATTPRYIVTLCRIAASVDRYCLYID